MKKLIFGIVLTLLNCSDNNLELSTKINFSIIGKRELYGNGDENISKSNIVISNLDIWNGLLNQINSVNMVSDNFIETDIDFSSYCGF